ncbi:MAG: hypothetical protein HKL79_05420 [Thermoplasmata archaeon]|nr:hypothetical protein [Thermoplasmata archaeon]
MVPLSTTLPLLVMVLAVAMTIKIKTKTEGVGEVELEGEAPEIGDLLQKMGYGRFPLRSLFPVSARRVTEAEEAEFVKVVPTNEDLAAYLRAHPGARTIEVINATYGEVIKSSGPTRRIYMRALKRVNSARRMMGQTKAVATDASYIEGNRGEEGDRPPTALPPAP